VVRLGGREAPAATDVSNGLVNTAFAIAAAASVFLLTARVDWGAVFAKH
jgi:hypothetical protein